MNEIKGYTGTRTARLLLLCVCVCGVLYMVSCFCRVYTEQQAASVVVVTVGCTLVMRCHRRNTHVKERASLICIMHGMLHDEGGGVPRKIVFNLNMQPQCLILIFVLNAILI